MKQIFTFLISTILICALALTASASGNEVAEQSSEQIAVATAQVQAPIGTGSAPSKEGAPTVESTPTDEGAPTPDSAPTDEGAPSGEDYNIFELIFDKICDYSGEIFCALTLIGTAVLSFAYKKGLLPLVRNSLTAIAGALGQLKENTELGTGALSEQSEKMKESLGRAESVLKSFEEKLTALEASLSGIDRLEKTQASTEIILRCQIDALSEVFMSSSLPEYRKAALGEKLNKMREALGDASGQRAE